MPVYMFRIALGMVPFVWSISVRCWLLCCWRSHGWCPHSHLQMLESWRVADGGSCRPLLVLTFQKEHLMSLGVQLCVCLSLLCFIGHLESVFSCFYSVLKHFLPLYLQVLLFFKCIIQWFTVLVYYRVVHPLPWSNCRTKILSLQKETL